MTVAIQQEMYVDAVLFEVKEFFHIEGLMEIERQQGNTAIRILVSHDEISVE